MAFHRLLPASALREGLAQDFRVGGEHLLLVVHNGRAHLLDNRCPHMGVAMAGGQLTADGAWRCPGHALDFDLVTGRNAKGLCPPVRTWTLAHDGPWLGVELP